VVYFHCTNLFSGYVHCCHCLPDMTSQFDGLILPMCVFLFSSMCVNNDYLLAYLLTYLLTVWVSR